MSNYRRLILETITNCILAESAAKIDFLIKNKKVEAALKNAIKKDPEIENKNITPRELLLFWDQKSPSLSKNIIWLAKQYSWGLFHNNDINRLENDLVKFEKYKRNKDLFNSSDLNKYDYSELKQKLDQINDEDISNLGSSARKNAVEKGKDEIEKIYESDKWLIISPETEAASRYWGKNTHWCTAADSEYNMFGFYNKKGPLYILINKESPDEKYQFHFETKQFMDKDDSYIDLKNFLKDNPEIKTPFKNKIDKTDPDNWIWLDSTNDLSYEMYLAAIEKAPGILQIIPDKFKTEELYLKAVLSSYDDDYDNDYSNDYYNRHGYEYLNTRELLEYIPDYIKTEDFYLKLVKENPSLLRYIPDEFKTKQIYLTALSKANQEPKEWNGLEILQSIPKDFKTEDMCLEALKKRECLPSKEEISNAEGYIINIHKWFNGDSYDDYIPFFFNSLEDAITIERKIALEILLDGYKMDISQFIIIPIESDEDLNSIYYSYNCNKNPNFLKFLDIIDINRIINNTCRYTVVDLEEVLDIAQYNKKTKDLEDIDLQYEKQLNKELKQQMKHKKESTMAYVIKIKDLTGEGKPDLYYAEPKDMRRALVADINQAKKYATEEEAYDEIDDSDVAELVIDYGYYNWESDEDGNVDFVDEVPGDAIDIITESKSLKDIRDRMNRIVESFDEAETSYNKVIELCYADWGDWDGHDDSTEPEQPNYICYYLYDAGVGGFADEADIPEIYTKLENEYIKRSDVLTEDKAHALKFDAITMDYDEEAEFCQNIADIFNAHKYMGREDWVANLKDL